MGAFGAGTLTKLDNYYNTVIGVSTGALMSPLVALRDWDTLKLAYTNIKGGNLFDSHFYKPRPVSKTGRLRRLPIIITLILGEKTIGTSNSLRKYISEFFTESHFNEITHRNIEILVGTQNFAESPSKVHYFSSNRETYDDFCDWMWCSANYPFLTSLVVKSWRDMNGGFHIGQWSDGGITDLAGIDSFVNSGYSDVDIVLHKIKHIKKYEGHQITSLLKNVVTGINAMRHDIEFESMYEKIKKLNDSGTNVTVYWLPYQPKADSLSFNGKIMTKWWQDGYNTANDPDRIEYFPAKLR